MKFITILILLMAFISGGCRDNSPTEMQKFQGMWKLDKYESLDPSRGVWFDTPNRIGYSGYILYDGVGHMGVQLLPPDFKEVDHRNSLDSLGADELRKTLKLQTSSFSYFANCNIINANTIQHHRISSNHPDEWGTTITRTFEFRGDTLVLTANELIGGLKTRLRWVKIK